MKAVPRSSPSSPLGSRLVLGLATLLTASACGGDGVPPGFARGSGRLEAQEIHVASRHAGRVAEVLVDEGDDVEAGQVLARLDAGALAAQVTRSRAQVFEARKRSEAAGALLTQRESECRLAEKDLRRAERLRRQSVVSEQRVDEQRTRVETARAACDAAEAQLDDANASIASALAEEARLREELDDATLRAPRAARVQYRLAEPGEVVPAGGRVLTLIDLTDVTLTLFLPTADAGRARGGAEARVVLDARPDVPLPARVTFVAREAQFTPKQVETASEREKLSFRVVVQVSDDRGLPINPGTPGVAWVRLQDDVPWPAALGSAERNEAS